MSIFIKNKEAPLITSTAKILISALLPTFQLAFLKDTGENIIQLQAHYSFEEKSFPVITLKNLACELKNNYSSS